jgi:hypothetical protein
MVRLARLCATALVLILPVCLAQTPAKKKAAPKPEPTAPELFAYIRGSLLSLSPDDGVNDNLEVSLDPTSTILTIKQPDVHCDQFLDAMDANTLVWDVFDASDSGGSRPQLLRLTVISVAGKTVRTCYDNQGTPDAKITSNRARFLFSYTKASDVPGFQTKIVKAMKKLIALSGGTPEKDLFGTDKGNKGM